MTTNIYYLIKASDVETMNYAPINGSPNQLFQYRISDNGKAIVQAEWINTEWLEVNGTFLGYPMGMPRRLR